MADVRSILDPLDVDQATKADAWDALHQPLTQPQFRQRFDALDLPRDVKRQLWDLKFPKSQPGAPLAPVSPEPQPSGGKREVASWLPPQAVSLARGFSTSLLGVGQVLEPLGVWSGIETVEDIGAKFGEWRAQQQQLSHPAMRRYEGKTIGQNPELLLDPTYLSNLTSEAVGSILAFFLPGGAAAGSGERLGVAAAKLVGSRPVLTRVAAALPGTAISSGLETLVDAADTYSEAITEHGASEEAALEVFGKTIQRELPLTTLTNLAGVYSPRTQGIWRRLLQASADASLEGAQEVLQGEAQASAIRSLGVERPHVGKIEEFLGGALGAATVGLARPSGPGPSGTEAPPAAPAVPDQGPAAPGAAPEAQIEAAEAVDRDIEGEYLSRAAAMAQDQGRIRRDDIREALGVSHRQAGEIRLKLQQEGVINGQGRYIGEGGPQARLTEQPLPTTDERIEQLKAEQESERKRLRAEFEAKAAQTRAEMQKKFDEAQAKLGRPTESTPAAPSGATQGALALGRAEGAPAETGPSGAIPSQEAGVSEATAASKPEDVGNPGWVGYLSPSDVEFDAPRFQYKQDVGQKGVGEEFRNVRTWDPEKAGVVHVWRDPADGKTYVVNGHHRLELAQRLGADRLLVRYMEASTAAEARNKGALINIAEGRGTSVDAAKVFRESEMSPAELENRGISLTGKVAEEGLALANLHPKIFTDVSTGKMPPARAAILGRGLDSQDDQIQLYDQIRKREKEGKRPTNSQIEELVRRATAPGTSEVTEQQESLFGTEDVTRKLIWETADVSDYVRKQLTAEKRLFGGVATEAIAERLGETGNVIEAEKNKQVAERAGQGLLLYDRLSVTSGPVADAIDQAARAIAEGKDANGAKQQAYDRVKQILLNQVDQLTGVSGQRGERAETSGEARSSEARPGQPDRRQEAPAETEVEAEPPAPKSNPRVEAIRTLGLAEKALAQAQDSTAAVDRNELVAGLANAQKARELLKGLEDAGQMRMDLARVEGLLKRQLETFDNRKKLTPKKAKAPPAKTEPTDAEQIRDKHYTKPRQKLFAAKLRKAAESLDKQIEAKRNPAVAEQRVTPRRASLVESAYAQAEHLERIQQAMNALADSFEAGTVPAELENVTSRAAVEDLLDHKKFPTGWVRNSEIQEILEASKGARGTKEARARIESVYRGRNTNAADFHSAEDISALKKLVKVAKDRGKASRWWSLENLKSAKRLDKAGITAANYEQARAALMGMLEAKPAEEPAAQKIRKMEHALIGRKIPGFFPTPREIVDEMIDYAEIPAGGRVLEPSGGKGNIAEALRKAGVKDLSVVEQNTELADILEAKGFSPVRGDFLEFSTDEQFDAVVMNPPFERGQDMDHVRKAFDLTKPGGTIVAIMSPHGFFANDAKSKAFREWFFDEAGGVIDDVRDLPEGAFYKEAGTNVKAKFVKIVKPSEYAERTRAEQSPGDITPPSLLSIRPVNPYDQVLAMLPKAEAFATKERDVVLLNTQARAVMENLLGVPFEAANVPAWRMQAAINQLDAWADSQSGKTQKGLRKLAGVLRKAILEHGQIREDSSFVLVHEMAPEGWETLIAHERTHSLQRALTAGVIENHIDEQAFLDDELADRARGELIAGGYPGDRSTIAAEIGAHLAAGPEHWRRLGLSREEAKQLLRRYVQALRGRHGAKAEEAIRRIAPQLEEVLDATDQIEQNLDSLVRAQQSRAGGELRPGVRPTVPRGEQAGLDLGFDTEAQAEAERRQQEQISGEQLSAEFATPLNRENRRKKLRKSKNTGQESLFETERDPQGSLFVRRRDKMASTVPFRELYRLANPNNRLVEFQTYRGRLLIRIQAEKRSPYTRTSIHYAQYSLSGDRVSQGRDRFTEPTQEELADFDRIAREVADRWTPSWEPILGQSLFVRFGALPKSGASRNWATGGREQGVSVYEASINAENGGVDLTGDTLPGALWEKAASGAPVFLVSGQRVGTGSDNEPLIFKPKVVALLDFSQEAGSFEMKSRRHGQESGHLLLSRRQPTDDGATAERIRKAELRRIWMQSRKLDMSESRVRKLAKQVAGTEHTSELTREQRLEVMRLMARTDAEGRPIQQPGLPLAPTVLNSPSYVLGQSRAGQKIYEAAEENFFHQEQIVDRYTRNYQKATAGLSKEEKRKIALFRLGVDEKGNQRDYGDSFLSPKLREINNRLTKFVYEPIWNIGVRKGLVARERHIDDYLTYYQDNRLRLNRKDIAETAAQIAMEMGIPVSLAERILEQANPKAPKFGPFDYARSATSTPGMMDLDQIAEIYIKGFARKVSITDFLKTADRWRPKIKDPALKRYAKQYMRQYSGQLPEGWLDDWIRRKVAAIPALRNTKLTAAQISGVMTSTQYLSKIGANPSTAAQNLTQTVMFTMPKAGTLRTLGVLPKSAAAVLLPNKLNPWVREAAKLKRSGVLDTQLLKFEKPQWHGHWGRFERAIGFLFNTAEEFNRSTAFFAGYDKAIAEGKSRAEAMKEGRAMVRQTQFFSGRLDAPLWQRTPTGRPIMQFKTFQIKGVEALRHMDWKERRRFALAGLALGGPAALGIVQLATILFGDDNDFVEQLEGWQENMHIAAFLHADNLARQIGIFIVPGLEDLGRYNAKESLLSWAAGPTISSMMDMAIAGNATIKDRQQAGWFISEIIRGVVPGGVELNRIHRAMTEAKDPADAMRILTSWYYENTGRQAPTGAPRAPKPPTASPPAPPRPGR